MEFDFSKNETVDTIDIVPEQFRGIYSEDPNTNKFNINPDFKGISAAIDGLNGALRNERKTSQTLKSQKDIASIIKENFGLENVEEVKIKIDELTNQVSEKSKIDPAKIKADIERVFSTERETLLNDNIKMQTTLERYLIDAAATGALAEAKGNVKLLLPIIKQQAIVVRDGEEYVVRITDGVGDYRGNGAGGFMSVADLVKELKSSSDYGIAFESDAPSGGGKPNGQQNTQNRHQQLQTSGSVNDKTPTQMIAAGLEARRGNN